MNIKLSLITLAIFLGSVHCTNAQVAQIPFEFKGTQLFFKAQTKNSDSLHFIFDSGTTGASIDSATLEKIGVQNNERSIASIAGSGGVRLYTLATNQSLKISNANITNINFAMVDFNHLSAITGSKIDGIIGYELLNQYVTKIDFDSRRMSFYQTIDKVDTTGFVGIPFEFSKGIMIPRFPIKITLSNGESFTGKAMFDTGNSFSLIVSSPFSKFHNFNDKLGQTSKTTGQGMNATTIDQLATINSMTFNGFKFGAMEIRLTVNDAAEPKDGYLGILGIEIIKRFNIIFDYAHHRIYLKPNKGYDAPLKQFMTKSDVELESKIFLDKNKLSPGVVTLPSGLQYKVIRQGKGPIATMDNRVTLQYIISTISGEKLWSTYDEKLPWVHHLDKALEGVKEAVLKMAAGSRWILYIPSSLAFGDQGFEKIPPGAAIIYDVEVVP